MSKFTHRPMMIMILVLMGSGVATNAWAQVDYSGIWDLTTTTHLADEQTPCEYAGTAQIFQNGIALEGTAQLNLTSGPGACPTEMTAMVTGQVNDSGVEWGLLMGGQLGEATFSSGGAAMMAQTEQTDKGGGQTPQNGYLSLSGPFDVTKGLYAGQSGSWSAMMTAMFESTPVPSLAFYGLLLLVLVLVAIAGFSLRRRHLVQL